MRRLLDLLRALLDPDAGLLARAAADRDFRHTLVRR
jgi:hypothetical protein